MNKVAKTTFKSGKRIKVWQIKGKKPGPEFLITAGIHGGENTGIQVAFELIDYFKTAKDLHGQVTIVPIVNIEGYKQQTRNNPVDQKNINASGVNGEYKPKNYSQSDAIADEILLLGQKHDFTIDLHSGSKNRYLHHICFSNHDDIEIARSLGFPFIVYQNESVKGSENNGDHKEALFSRIGKKGKLALAIETGGGLMPWREDVDFTLKGIISFCAQIGLLKNSQPVEKTPKSQIFTKSREDIALTIKAPRVGNLYCTRGLGEIIKKGETMGFIIEPKTQKRFSIKSPIEGMLILNRTLPQIKPEAMGKEAIFRLMPKSANHV